jgi:hypothetical protein
VRARPAARVSSSRDRRPPHIVFSITQPQTGTQWVNGQANLITWQKPLLDNIHSFDIELTRLSSDGIIYVASGGTCPHLMTLPCCAYWCRPAVPASTPNNALNLALDSVPPGDDYFLIFLNSSHQTTYTVSSRFTILASGGTPASAGG